MDRNLEPAPGATEGGGGEPRRLTALRARRRDVVKGAAAAAGGIAAASYVAPNLRGLGLPVALAMSGGPLPPPPPPVSSNLCAGIFSPGFWKNYNVGNGPPHLTDAQFYALLTSTVDFGATFSALSQSAAISLAETILGLQGSFYVRSLLAAELNVANMPSLGTGLFTPTGGTAATVNSLLTAAYTANGTGNSSPFTNGTLTTAEQDVIGYLSGGGENASAASCRVIPPT